MIGFQQTKNIHPINIYWTFCFMLWSVLSMGNRMENKVYRSLPLIPGLYLYLFPSSVKCFGIIEPIPELSSTVLSVEMFQIYIYTSIIF